MSEEKDKQKSWIEIFIMPLVVAAVGSLGTYFITHQQEANAVAKANSDRQVKILEIFAEKITHDDAGQRLLAIKMLRALDPDLAEKLALAVAETEPENSVTREVATNIGFEAKAITQLQPRVYIHVNGSSERDIAKKLEELLEKNEWNVPGIERVGSKSPNQSQFRYFKKAESAKAKEIHQFMVDQGYDVALRYIGGYEDSNNIRPMHFEVWFSKGMPQ